MSLFYFGIEKYFSFFLHFAYGQVCLRSTNFFSSFFSFFFRDKKKTKEMKMLRCEHLNTFAF